MKLLIRMGTQENNTFSRSYVMGNVQSKTQNYLDLLINQLMLAIKLLLS